MAFKPISPLTLVGVPKYFSVVYHRLIEHSIFAFAELNLADRLVDAVPDRGLTAREIIDRERLNWNETLLHRVLRSCTDAGVVERVSDEKRFVLTESGQMLTSNHPSHARDLIRWMLGPLHTTGACQMPNLVRNEITGSGIAQVTGGIDVYTFLSRPEQKDLLDTFNNAMTAFSTYTGTKLVTGVDFGRFETVVDIGSSSGAYVAQILEHYPSIKQGTVFDLPHVIKQVQNGEEFKSRMIAESKYKFVAGDMFDSSTIPRADAYVIKHVLHNFDDAKVVDILSSIRQANQDRIKQSSVSVFIVEHIILPDGAMSNWQSHALDIAMLYACENASERTQQEFERLFEKAGLKFKKLYPIQAPNSIIEATFVN